MLNIRLGTLRITADFMHVNEVQKFFNRHNIYVQVY